MYCLPMQLVYLNNKCNRQRWWTGAIVVYKNAGTPSVAWHLTSWGVGLYSDSSFDRLSVTSMLTALPGPASLALEAVQRKQGGN